MRLKTIAPIFFILLLTINFACEETNSTTNQDAFSAITISDSLNREIRFTEPPKRIIAFDSAAVEILFSIGEGKRIVGTHDFVSFPPETASIPKVGDAFNMNLESVIELNPDLVFVFSPSHIQNLEKAGLKVLYLESRQSGLREIPKDILMWGKIVGSESQAAAISKDFEEKTISIQNKIASQKQDSSVFQDIGGFWTPGNDTLMNDVFNLLSLSNIAFDINGYQQIGVETIVERNPEIILASDVSVYTTNSNFSNLAAATNGRIIELNDESLSIAGPRFIIGVTNLAKVIYPEIFE